MTGGPPHTLDLLASLAGRCRVVPLLDNHEELLLGALRLSAGVGCLAAGDRGLRRHHKGPSPPRPQRTEQGQ
jgi:hypothetical protein